MLIIDSFSGIWKHLSWRLKDVTQPLTKSNLTSTFICYKSHVQGMSINSMNLSETACIHPKSPSSLKIKQYFCELGKDGERRGMPEMQGENWICESKARDPGRDRIRRPVLYVRVLDPGPSGP